MASIAKTAIQLTTDAGKALSGLNTVKSMLMGWAGSIKSGLGSALKGAGGMIGTALQGGALAGLAGIGVGAAKAVEGIANLAKQGQMADALGIGVEKYTALTAAMKTLGFESEDVADVLTDLSDKVQDAAVFGGDAGETFQLLGVDAKELAKLPVDQQLARVADAFATMKDKGEAAGLAVRLLSDNGLKLMPVFNQGSEALKKLTDAAVKNGQAVDASKMADIQAAQATLTSAGATLSGLWTEVVVMAAPALELLSAGLKTLTEDVGRSEGGYASWRETVGGAFGTAVAVLGGFWDTLKAGEGLLMQVLYFPLNAIGSLLKTVASAIRALGDQLPDSIRPDAINQVAAALENAGNFTKDYAKDVDASGKALTNSWGQSVTAADDWFQKVKAKQDQIRKDTEEAKSKAAGRRTFDNADIKKKLSDTGGGTGPKEIKGFDAVLTGSTEFYKLQAQSMNAAMAKQQDPKEKIAQETLNTMRELVRVGKEQLKQLADGFGLEVG